MKRIGYILLSAVLISLVGWNCWQYKWAWHDFFYHFNILERAILYLLIVFLIREFERVTGKHYKFTLCMGLIGAGNMLSDLIDEIFFNPMATNWNDWIFLIVIIILSIKVVYARR